MPVERMFNKELSGAIRDHACSMDRLTEHLEKEFEWRKSHLHLATKQDLKETEQRIMSKISEFAEKQNAFNDRVDAAVTGLQGDIQALNDKITELQNSPGQITPEDQALLDAIQTRSEGIAAKVEALDALTPPVVPPPVP